MLILFCPSCKSKVCTKKLHLPFTDEKFSSGKTLTVSDREHAILRKAEYPDRNLPEAKVKREESPTASSPQRLIFSRRRPYIPAAVPCHHPMPSHPAISSRNAMSCLKALPSCNSSRQGCHATAIHIGYTLSRCSGIGLI